MKSVISLVLIVVSQVLYHFSYLNLISASLCTAAAILLLFINNSDGYKYPPGPTGLPILGNLPWILHQNITDYFMKLRNKYGNIFILQLGQKKAVVINDYETIKEFTNNPHFQDRPFNLIDSSDIFTDKGVLNSEGSMWKYQRRFVLHSLRDIGMGKIHFQHKVLEEFKHLVDDIRKTKGKPFDMNYTLKKAACNVIFTLAFGKRFDYYDPNLIKKMEMMTELNESGNAVAAVPFFPLLRFFIKKNIDRNDQIFKEFQMQSGELIEEHKTLLDVNNPRDFIDLFLIEMHKQSDEENKEYLSTFSEEQLNAVITELFLAGTETTSNTITWAIIYMLHHPDIQERVQAEIDDLIGQERSPDITDKSNLHFTVATLQEVERLASIVPLGLIRSNNKAAEFKGYKFPPRCMYFINLYSVHRDEKLWKDPEKFNPSRFIDSKGKVSRPPYLLPFGSGKRNCAGESLARMEIFLSFTMLMQHFKFSAAGDTLPPLEIGTRAFRIPERFSVRAQARF